MRWISTIDLVYQTIIDATKNTFFETLCSEFTCNTILYRLYHIIMHFELKQRVWQHTGVLAGYVECKILKYHQKYRIHAPKRRRTEI